MTPYLGLAKDWPSAQTRAELSEWLSVPLMEKLSVMWWSARMMEWLSVVPSDLQCVGGGRESCEQHQSEQSLSTFEMRALDARGEGER